ncbi:MAG: glycosyltransferase family 2 protein [Bacteroidales bacterium]|nr:glycosyltransferase family 2 protein [Bacteroidales bacterium]
MIKLSAVIITFNEEKNIERCLLSLQDVADEIIVLDSFSADKTEDICKSYNVKFFKHKFDGHIEQKNRAITFAENDFVLSLDADEILSSKLITSIKKIKEKPEYDAYYFNRLNIYCGKEIKHGAWYPDRKIRLWNKRKGAWGGINPHDTVILKEGVEKKHLKGNLLHYSFNTIEEHLLQVNKFSTIGAEQLVKKNKKHLLFKAIVNPTFRFFKNYFLKLGFLGGYTTFLISVIISFETFLKYSKAIQLKKQEKD